MPPSSAKLSPVGGRDAICDDLGRISSNASSSLWGVATSVRGRSPRERRSFPNNFYRAEKCSLKHQVPPPREAIGTSGAPSHGKYIVHQMHQARPRSVTEERYPDPFRITRPAHDPPGELPAKVSSCRTGQGGGSIRQSDAGQECHGPVQVPENSNSSRYSCRNRIRIIIF